MPFSFNIIELKAKIAKLILYNSKTHKYFISDISNEIHTVLAACVILSEYAVISMKLLL